MTEVVLALRTDYDSAIRGRVREVKPPFTRLAWAGSGKHSLHPVVDPIIWTHAPCLLAVLACSIKVRLFVTFAGVPCQLNAVLGCAEQVAELSGPLRKGLPTRASGAIRPRCLDIPAVLAHPPCATDALMP